MKIALACLSFGAGWVLVSLVATQSRLTGADPPARLDPAAWGGDHVGKPLPEFISGDECLFCHRMDVGPTWRANRHQLSLRAASGNHGRGALAALKKNEKTKKIAEQVEYLLGGSRHIRFMKRTGRYGELALLTTAYKPGKDAGELVHSADPTWNDAQFNQSCAGCHTSGVETESATFTELSLDCFVCHGETKLTHSKNPREALFSKKKAASPRVVASVCGQCHLRGGKSRSTKRPYPNQYVAGDNLFRDFQVDWSDEHIKSLNPADRHIFENIRDIVVYGKQETTCLSCHRIHDSTSEKHQSLRRQTLCGNCHQKESWDLKPFQAPSQVCGY